MNEKNVKNIKIINVNSLGDIVEVLDEVWIDKSLQIIILELSNPIVISNNNNLTKRVVEKIKHFPIPIISKLKTDVIGCIFEIVLASHLCFVAENVKFKITNESEVRKQIGIANSEKSDFIEKEIDAKTALDLGLINGVINSDNLDEEVLIGAKKIAQLAPIAIKSCLEAVNKGSEMDLEDGLKLEMKLFSQIFSTKDMKEGTSAFLEKRTPVFKGE